MKNATSKIVRLFPGLKDLILKQNNADSVTLENFNEIERTFLKLARFFENPNEEDFDLTLIYLHLKDGWLELALEAITLFFQKDTYLIQHPSLSIIKESSDYLNQSQFAEYLTVKGLKYDRAKVKNYYDRGKIPAPDLVVAGTKFWSPSTAESYCEQEKRRLKST